MPPEPRAVVLPFPIRPGAPAPRDPAAPPAVTVGDEEALNAAWDHLLWLAVQAWSWRDPESLASVERAASALTPDVARDWK